MAARGRGRGGWRGGRAGGRGGMQAPALRDDEGNFVEVERNEGPPPLFPAIELKNDPPEPTPQDKLLLLRRTDLKRYYKNSPYYIEASAGTAAAGKRNAAGRGTDEVERYSDKCNKRTVSQQQKPPLASILTLLPHHFPEELFSDKDKRLAARGAGAAGDLFMRNPASADASSMQQHLNSLAAREQEKGTGGAGPEGQAAAAAEGEHPEDEAVAVDDEDDDDVMQEDDYYQGEYFDDDEGYDDYDDGGADDGAIY